MRKNDFMLVLKNPPISIMVDNFDCSFLAKEGFFLFMEQGLITFIARSVDSNIAYIKELSPEEKEKFLENIKKLRDKADERIVKPKFVIPRKQGKPN